MAEMALNGFTGQCLERRFDRIDSAYKWLHIVCRGDMMPLLQVRDCPEDIYKKIALVAKSENRSIAQQVIVLLEKGLGQEQSNMDRRRKLIERIESREVNLKLREIDAVAMIREDRDR